MTPEERLRRYAELAVRVGANVQEGQDVVISCLVEHAEIARAIARESYRAGAKHVIVLYNDLHLRRATIELGPEEELDWSPPYLLDWSKRWADERPAVIGLSGNPDPGLLADLDPALVGKAVPRELSAVIGRELTQMRLNWVGVAAPNPGWATQVFGEPDVERLWDAVAVATRLDADDVRAAWAEHVAMLAGRSDALTGRAFDAIRFTGPGTDLLVGLLSEARWVSGKGVTETGIEYIPNLPTEEVFTSPDYRRTEGVVRSTAPLVTGGTRIEGLELRFEGGKVVEANAATGADVVRQQLAIDEYALLPGRGRARRRIVAREAHRARLPRHALRREHHLPSRVRRRLPVRPGRRRRAHGRGAARTRRERLRDPHGLHDRRSRGGRRRHRRGRIGDADHPGRRLAAVLTLLRAAFCSPQYLCSSRFRHVDARRCREDA